MKVLQINAVYGVGSTGVIVRDIHNLCLKEGLESYVAYSSFGGGERPKGVSVGKTLGKKVHALLCRINGKQAYFSSGSTRKLLTYIKSLAPDVVVLHNLHSNYIHLNKLLSFLAREEIRTVIVLHDCWFFTGGCFHYTSVGCDRWLHGCGHCPKKKMDTVAYLMDRSAKIFEDRKKYLSAIKNLTVVGVSEWISQEAQKNFLGEKKVTYIHNGVDSEIFQPTASTLREKYHLQDRFVILGLASKFFLPKNQETYERIVSSLHSDETLVLLGCTSEQSKNLPNGVLGLPFIRGREELCQVYSMADVFVNCTREDTLPTVNLEAQACGTPVVTYANTGARETVDGACGFAVENGNAAEMIEKIALVKQYGKNAFSESCRDWIVTHFDKNMNYRKYLELFLQKNRE